MLQAYQRLYAHIPFSFCSFSYSSSAYSLMTSYLPLTQFPKKNLETYEYDYNTALKTPSREGTTMFPGQKSLQIMTWKSVLTAPPTFYLLTSETFAIFPLISNLWNTTPSLLNHISSSPIHRFLRLFYSVSPYILPYISV